MADLPGDSAPPADPPHDYAALFGVERDRLNDLLAGLREGGLAAAFAVPRLEHSRTVRPSAR